MSETSVLGRRPAWLWLVRVGLLAPAVVAFAISPGDLIPVVATVPSLIALALLARPAKPDWLRAGLKLTRALGLVTAAIVGLLGFQLCLDPCTHPGLRTLAVGLFVIQLGLVRAPGFLLGPDATSAAERGQAGGDVLGRAGEIRDPSRNVLALRGLGYTLLAAFSVFAFLVLAAPGGHGSGRRVGSNESSAIGELRALTSAQSAYAEANGGLYGSLECLNTPGGCLADRDHQGLVFLARQEPKRRGYVYELETLPAADGKNVRSWAYTATPADQGCTGVRAFCVDDTGVVRQSPAGVLPPLAGGRCPVSLDEVK